MSGKVSEALCGSGSFVVIIMWVMGFMWLATGAISLVDSSRYISSFVDEANCKVTQVMNETSGSYFFGILIGHV